MARVFISAGHFPQRPGACWRGFCEYDEADKWVKEIGLAMHEEFATQVPPGAIKSKVEYIRARAVPGDVVVEIHFGYSVGEHPSGRGCIAMHTPYDEESRELARVCLRAVSRYFAPSLGVTEGWYRGRPDFGPHFLLGSLEIPAVLLEPQFIHHREEIQRKRAACCEAIAAELLEFVA